MARVPEDWWKRASSRLTRLPRAWFRARDTPPKENDQLQDINMPKIEAGTAKDVVVNSDTTISFYYGEDAFSMIASEGLLPRDIFPDRVSIRKGNDLQIYVIEIRIEEVDKFRQMISSYETKINLLKEEKESSFRRIESLYEANKNLSAEKVRLEKKLNLNYEDDFAIITPDE
jgi:hypothetical protein